MQQLSQLKTVEEHVLEFRSMLLSIVALALVVFLLSLTFSSRILSYIVDYAGLDLVALSPTEAASAIVNVSLVFASLFSLPYAFYRFSQFVKPAFKIGYAPTFSLMLFLVGFFSGVYLGYFSTEALRSLASGIGVRNMWSVNEYLNFIIISGLLSGFSFQIPLLMRLSNSIGLVSKSYFKSMRSIFWVVIITAIAVISPQGDMLSLILMSTPGILLYEVGCI